MNEVFAKPLNNTVKSLKFKGWEILLNAETGCYDLYLPEDAEAFSNKDLREYCSPEMEDVPSIEEAIQFIREY